MKTIRRNVFETNSSSTHSITMCMEGDYEKWKNGELYYLEDSDKFVNKEQRDIILKKLVLEDKMDIDYNAQIITFKGQTVHYEDWKDKYKKIDDFCTDDNLNEITEEEVGEYFKSNFDRYEMPCTYDEYYDDLEYETYKTKFTTPKGESVISFGYYGQNY